MPIEQHPGGSISITGQGIPLYRLMAMRSAVGLEAKGIKMHRRSITAMAMREFKCKRSEVMAKLDAAIETLGARVKAGE